MQRLEQGFQQTLLLVLICLVNCRCTTASEPGDFETIVTDSTDSIIRFKDNSFVEKSKMIGSRMGQVLQKLGICTMDTAADYLKQEYYYYCDSNYIQIIPLQSRKRTLGFYLIKISINTGSGGQHNFILKKSGSGYKKVNFFQGWYDSVIVGKGPFHEIVATLPGERNDERVEIVLSEAGHKFAFKRLVKVYMASPQGENAVKEYNPKYKMARYWQRFLSYSDGFE